ncbi:MAG: PAS domain S-box protein [Ignavibacteriae bacterium]|nr:PAS domain S-box protein [Ignavibacteriota bacterium]
MIKPAEGASPKSSAIRYKVKFPVSFSLTLFSLTLGFVILILYYFNHQKYVLTEDIKSDLKVIAEMKAKQISNWRNERLLDGSMIFDNKIMMRELKSIASGSRDEMLRQNIFNWFRDLCKSHNYISVRLASKDGEMHFSYPEDAIKIGKKGISHLIESKESKKPFLSNFHIYENTDKIHLDMIVPVLTEADEEPEIFVMLEIDPKEYLYPLIQVWPAESETAETLLTEKIGDEVVYLNELRHKSNTSLKLKLKLENDSIPAVLASKGKTGFVDGIDYRHSPVLAYIEPVPGTEWKLIAKKDKSEIYGDINVSSLWVAILVLLVIITAGGIIVLYWSKQKEKFLKSLIDADRKQIALTTHFDNIIKNANDAFILYDENARVVEVNEKAYELYGYTREEFIGLDLNDLRAPEFRGDVSDTIKYVKNHPDGLLFETRHIKKDGTVFTVESSTRFLQLGSKFFFQSVIRDITERKQAEAALRESEEKFSSIFKYNPVSVMIAKKEDGRIIDVNDELVKDSGYSREEIIGKTTVEMGFFSDERERNKFLKEVEEKGYAFGVENEFRTKSGEIKNCLSSTVKVGFGDRFYYITSVLDITERKKAEERIQYLNRLYAFLSQVNQAIVRIENRQELFDNICKIAIEFGKFQFAWIGLVDNPNNRIFPVASAGMDNGYLNIIKDSAGNNLKTNQYLNKLLNEGINIITNEIRNDEFYVNDRNDAIERGYESSGIFPLKEQGNIIGILCLYSDKINRFDEEEVRLLDEVSMDITFALDYYIKEKQRREFNDALTKSERKFRTLFDNAGDAILLLDDYKFIEFNKSAEEIFGLSRNDLLFKSPVELSPEFQPDGRSSDLTGREYMSRAYNGENVRFEWLHTKPDGTVFEAEVSLNSVYIGSMKMLLSVMRDITERKKYEEGLRAAVEKAEEMNKVKSNFLANMSHELRTPMTGILGFADILSKTLEDPEQKEMAQVIYKGGRRLTNTLNMILDLSKIEAEKIDVDLKTCSLSEIINESVKLFEATAKEKKLQLNAEIKNEVNSVIDSRLLEQVLANLIKNAIIYTEKGGVTVSLEKIIEGNIEFAEIKIIDTGIGIPEDSLNIIFEPFRQVSEGWTRSFEGTGLGLTISKKFVELMGGAISVRSTVDVGTEFIIRFKSAGLKKEIQEKEYNGLPENEIILKKRNIKTLLVEDDEFTVFTIKRILKDVCIFDLTNNGIEAVKLAGENRYDIILMDIGLKGMDGLEATKKIRQLHGYEKTPIVALTAYAMEGDKERFLMSGCSHYLSKPFTNSNLINLVNDLA